MSGIEQGTPGSKIILGTTILDLTAGILLRHKKDEILPFVTTWMDLEGINTK